MLFISFHAPALAWCLLLKHRGAFGASVIVVFESLSVKRCISKSYTYSWNGFKIGLCDMTIYIGWTK